LGPREREVIALVAQGKTDAEIGIILNISEHTVHNTVRRVMGKYGVASRIQAFARALREGEIQLEEVAP
jgi:DNA-binding CsgD family transcriptional regulator